MGKKGDGIKYNWWLQNSLGDVKYSIGRVAKEHICMTHGHGQQGGNCLRESGVLGRGE